MPIEKVGNFFTVDDLGITPCIGVETNRINKCINAVKKKKLQGVFGHPSFGFKQDNLDFFIQIPELIQIWFWDIDLKNIDGIYHLSELKYFGVHDRRPGIDFSTFQHMEFMVWTPRANDNGIGTLNNLKQIEVWRWKPQNKTYDGIELPENLKQLELNWCNPSSLSGIRKLNKLKELQIHYCRNLISISDIFEIAPNLEKLIIANCPNLKLGKEIDEISNLKHAYINQREY